MSARAEVGGYQSYGFRQARNGSSGPCCLPAASMPEVRQNHANCSSIGVAIDGFRTASSQSPLLRETVEVRLPLTCQQHTLLRCCNHRLSGG